MVVRSSSAREIRLVPWAAFDGSILIVGKAHTKITAMRTRVVTVPRITAKAEAAVRDA